MEDFIMSKENEDIAKINEKEQYKYGKTTPTFKRITEFTQKGEIVREETKTIQGERREKGTFFQSDPEEFVRFINTFFKRKEERLIFEYIVSNINYSNEFSFNKKWLSANFKDTRNFNRYRLKLEKDKWIFKTTKKNVYTLNVQLFNRMTARKAFELYKTQFREDFDKDINTFMYLSKIAQNLNKTEIKQLIKQLENHLKK